MRDYREITFTVQASAYQPGGKAVIICAPRDYEDAKTFLAKIVELSTLSKQKLAIAVEALEHISMYGDESDDYECAVAALEKIGEVK